MIPLFSNPYFLLALVPWGAWVVWLMVWCDRPVNVPFVRLWPPGQADQSHHRRKRLPIALVLIAASVALAILAGAGPSISLGERGCPRLSLVIDRGAAMSAGPADLPLFRQQALDVLDQLRPQQVRVRLVPGSSTDWLSADAARRLISSAAATAWIPESDRSLSEPEWFESGLPVRVLSSLPAPAGLPRHVAWGARLRAEPNWAVTRVGVAPGEPTRVLVGLRADSVALPARVEIVVSWAKGSEAHSVVVTSRDSDHTLSVAAGGAWVCVAVADPGLIHADDRAYGLLEARSSVATGLDVSPEVRRAVDAHNEAAAVPGAPGAWVIGPDAAEPDGPYVRVLSGDNPSDPRNWQGGAADLADVAWLAGLPSVNCDRGFVPAGQWDTVLADARGPVLIRRSGPVRAVVMRFDPSPWARDVRYPQFMSRLLGWVSNGGSHDAPEAPGLLGPGWQRLAGGGVGDPGWWPGVYHQGRSVRVVNPLPAPVLLPVEGVAEVTASLRSRVPAFALGPWLHALAAILLATGLILWGRPRPAAAV